MRKHLHSFIQQEIEKEGYGLLSEYKDSKTKLDVICPNGHLYKVAWGVFSRGHRCGKCAGVAALSQDFVQKSIEKEGYKLLSRYTKNSVYLDLICPQGHFYQAQWKTWRRGNRCGICSGRISLSQDFVQKSIEKEGYKLLSEYKNNRTKLVLVCPQEHQHKTTWKMWWKGVRCLICSGRGPISQGKVEASFQKEGYRLLSLYENNTQKLDFVCPKGHKHKINWRDWGSGYRCGYCHADKIGGDYCTYKATGRIKNAISRQVKKDSKKWSDFYDKIFIQEVAISVNSVYQHISKGFSVDHIVPCSWFDLTKNEELIACWQLKNLRHLPFVENVSRGNRIKKEEFLRLLETHADILSIASRIPKTYQEIISSLDPAE